MATVTVGGCEVSGATGGRELDAAGPLVILVHGAAMNRTVWALQTRWLAHHGLPALAVDLPGHGASTEPERGSIEEYAEWLAGVVVEAGRPVHLVGHSMGSYIVLETARRTPVASITLVGTAAGMPVHPTLLEAAAANDPLAARLMSGWAFAHETRSGPHPSPGASMIGGAQALIEQAAPGVLHHDLAMCADYDRATTTAAELSVPVTFLLGTDDRMTPVHAAQALIDACEHVRVEVLPGIGHMLQIEAPIVTREVIAETVRAA